MFTILISCVSMLTSVPNRFVLGLLWKEIRCCSVLMVQGLQMSFGDGDYNMGKYNKNIISAWLKSVLSG